MLVLLGKNNKSQFRIPSCIIDDTKLYKFAYGCICMTQEFGELLQLLFLRLHTLASQQSVIFSKFTFYCFIICLSNRRQEINKPRVRLVQSNSASLKWMSFQSCLISLAQRQPYVSLKPLKIHEGFRPQFETNFQCSLLCILMVLKQSFVQSQGYKCK